ncbi:MAG: hypothetical protein F6K58_19965 [Symploca sp. SIO2E9]|nr:hypothetical protein [Symploca sp. SIO2E9]
MPRSLEFRQEARARCLKHRPWEKSTGPRSAKGKRISSRNAKKKLTVEEKAAKVAESQIKAVLRAIEIWRSRQVQE